MRPSAEHSHQLFEDSTREESPIVKNFIDIMSIGLHRSARLQRQAKGRPSSSKGALCRATKAIGLVDMQVSSIIKSGAHTAYHFYVSQIVSYTYFLDLSCNGGSNSINLVVHLASMTDNEVHTLGEMKI